MYSYVPKRWRLEPKGKGEARQAKETKVADNKAVGVPPSSSGLIQTLEGGVLTKRSSRIANRKDGGEGETFQFPRCLPCLLGIILLHPVYSVHTV